jgi:hypothetical protein
MFKQNYGIILLNLKLQSSFKLRVQFSMVYMKSKNLNLLIAIHDVIYDLHVIVSIYASHFS